MVQITSTTGLISGIDYDTLIANLIKAESAQKDQITAQNTTLQKKQTALTTLMANLTALKGSSDILGRSTLYDTTTATSSNSSLLSVTTTGIPIGGTYQFTPLAKAQAQQSNSSNFDSATSLVGQGKFSFRFGNTVATSMSLANINGGAGFTAGKIKITDRNGTANIIDLTGARTIDDVIDAINNNGLADVTASVSGDHIVLTDNTGETHSNLKVQEVNSGTTAASLGLAGINVSDVNLRSAAGSDIVYLSENLNLNALNDGIGMENNSSASDITFKLSNGDTGTIRLAGSTAINDIIDKIKASSSFLTASINSDKKLTVTDSSGGKGDFTLSADNDSKALADLGLTGTAFKGVVTGSLTLAAGVDTMLSALNGGAGVRMNQPLPDITYTLKNGNTGEIKLAGTKTLGEVIAKFNAANTNLKASINTDGSGLTLTDLSTGTGTFTISDENESKALEDLGVSGTAVDGVITGRRIISGAKTVLLSSLNGGHGLGTLGRIDLTDRANNSATVDLSTAQTLEDVIIAINASGLQIKAQVNDAANGIKLVDTSGQTASNLKVQNNADGTTTADKLFGSAVNVAANSANTGDLHLHYIGLNTKLADLNGGAGVAQGSFTITNSKGVSASITINDATQTIGDVIKAINLSKAHVLAEINDTGDGIAIQDSNGGTSKILVTEKGSGAVAANLGLLQTATAKGSIQGDRIVSGMKTVLISSLHDGNGLGTLGLIDLTDRAGSMATVDLSTAQTLDDVINSINASGLQITAQVNDAANGIKLVDTSGQTISNLKVQNNIDGTTTADKLFGSAVDVDANSANTGDLHFRYVDLNTKLADLHGGSGVVQGSIKITNSRGDTTVITIDNTITTVGDLINTINSSSAKVEAEINATGDGIAIHDLYSGNKALLTVSENGSTTGASLGLLKTATIQNSTQEVHGSMTRTLDISDTATLQNLSNAINNLKAGVTAAVASQGAEAYSLQITSNRTGAKSAFIIDTSQMNISFDWTAKAQDALLVIGSTSSTSKARLVSSSTNSLTNVLSGATLTIQSASDNPVSISVGTDTASLATQIKTFVNTYNTFRKTLNTNTVFDTSTETAAVLTGDYTARQMDIDLSKLISDYFPCGNTVSSIRQLGISFDTVLNDGSLKLDENVLNSTLNTNLSDVKALFTTADTGIAAKFSNVISSLAVDVDPENPKSLVGMRNKALQESVDKNQENIDAWTKRLDTERTRLLNQFANLETTLAKTQNNLQALSSIQWMMDSSSSSDNSLFKSS